MNELLQRIGRSLGDRAAVAVGVVGAAVGVVAVWLLPELPYGEWLAERLWLHRTWPLLPLAVGGLFWWAGAARHRSSGRPVFAPPLATAGLLAVAVMTAPLADRTAGGWPGWWLPVAGLAVAGGVAAAVRGWFAYAEVWRTGFEVIDADLRVVAHVGHRIATDPAGFAAAARSQARRRWADPPWLTRLAGRGKWGKVAADAGRAVLSLDRHPWGSPHALLVVTHYYEDHRRKVLTRPAPTRADIAPYLGAAEALVAYLSLEWADKQAVAGRAADILRQVLTVWLKAAQSGGWQPGELQAEVTKWLRPGDDGSGFHDALPVMARQFWCRLLPLACAELHPDPLAVGDERLLLAEASTAGGRFPPADRRPAALTWLLVGTRLPDAARLAPWLATRDPNDLETAEPAAGDDLDPALTYGRAALAELLTRRADDAPGPWADPVRRLADRVAAGRLADRRRAVAALLTEGKS